MAADTQDGKRQRLSSWSGPSQSHSVHHHPSDSSASYANPALPLPIPHPAYHEHDQRELPNVYHAGSGYATPMDGVAHSYPPDQAFARPSGTTIKTGSPGEPPHPPLRSLSLPGPSDGSHALQAHQMDHPSLETHHAMSMSNHDGMPPTHSGSYAPSPISSGPRDSYYMGGPLVTTYPPRRKAIRAAQACDACRQRKAKCDEGRPACGFCKEAMVPCVYREVPPPKQDRTLLQILHKLDKLDSVESEIHEIRGFIRSSLHINGTVGLADRSRVPAVVSGLDARRPSGAPVVDARVSQAEKPSITATEPLSSDAAKADDNDGIGELSIPIEHTTAAHKLLRWPSIRKLVDPVTQNEHYVMQGEERRGLLRIWGRGEGGDAPNGGPLSVVSYGAGFNDDEWLRGQPSSYPAESLWGAGLSRAGGVDMRRPAVESIGGLNPDGSLKLDAPTLTRLLTSYSDNIHIMHPILDADRISQLVRAFADRYQSPASCPPRSPFVVPSPQMTGDIRRDSVATLTKASKRKRSSSNLPGNSPTGSYPGSSYARGPPERSIGSALVLLVAALGKICEHRDFLPGPVPDTIPELERLHPMVDSSPFHSDSPPFKHSPASSHSSGLTSGASPQDISRSVYPPRRTSIDASSPAERGAWPINADVIPGLAYYAYATDILGNLHGGNELAHVQAGLLAGLYAGQLGRVMESWKWINWACTGCQVLVRRTSFAAEDLPQTNPIVVAFWTCLQLESDILAELDLPPSGISRLEEVMPFPQIRTSLMWTYYTAQIYLRKLLNRVHYALYKPGHDSKQSGWSMAELAELERQLRHWRELLPGELQWNDSEPPPSNINAARLRAKYYGARYIIYRPFLHYAIHLMDQPGESVSKLPDDSPPFESGRTSTHESPTRPVVSQAFGTVSGRSGSEAMPPPRPTASYTRLDDTVMNACRSCITAAMQSTAAFHGISQRPIVTNIFGTAHAQFGNLLVLQAASRHPILRDLVPRDKVTHLLTKTIVFLRNLSPISPTLKFDAEILERSMRPVLQPSSSFSSSTESSIHGR